MSIAVKSALLVATCLVSQTNPSTGITYRNEGANLATICADLSKLTGQNLKVSPQAGKEILAIRVQSVDPTTLENKIAEVVHGDWVDDSGAKKLTLDSTLEGKDRRRHDDLVVQAFQNALDAEAKTLANQPNFDAREATIFAGQVSDMLAISPSSHEYAKRINDLASRSPGRRAIDRILASFPASELASLPPRIRVVYSNSPNQAQRALNDAALSSAISFVQEQTYWADQAKEAIANNPRFRALPDFLSDIDSPRGAPTKLLVGLFRESENGRVRIDLKVADTTGKIVCRASSSIKPKMDPASISGLSVESFGKKLVLAPESLQIAPDGYRRHPLTAPVFKEITHPLEVEPLSIGYGKTLVSLSDGEGTNLVANLSDQLIDGALHDGMSVNHSQYLKLLPARGQSVKLDQNWLTVAPDDIYFTREIRADRTLLQEYVQGETLPNFPLERQAACAVGLPDPLDNFLPSELVSTIKHRPVGLQNVALLRFYGSLTEEDMRAAQSRNGIALASLSSQAVQYLNEVVYGEMGSLVVNDPLNGIGRDPTECLSNGYAPNSVLFLHVDNDPAFFDLSKDQLPYSLKQGSISPGEIAFMMYSRAHPDKYPEMAEKAALIDTPCFCSGTYSRYQFQFRLAPTVFSNGELESRSLDNESPMRLADLPSDFRSKIDAQFAQIEKDEKAAGGTTTHSTAHTSTP